MPRVIVDKPVIGTTIDTATENNRFAQFAALSVNTSNVALNAIEHRHLTGQAQVVDWCSVRYTAGVWQTIQNMSDYAPVDKRQAVTNSMGTFTPDLVAKAGNMLRVMVDAEVDFEGSPYWTDYSLGSGAHVVWIIQPYIRVAGVWVPIGIDMPHGDGGIWGLYNTVPIQHEDYKTNIRFADPLWVGNDQTAGPDRVQWCRDYVLTADVTISRMQLFASGPYEVRGVSDPPTLFPTTGLGAGKCDLKIRELAFSMLVLRK